MTKRKDWNDVMPAAQLTVWRSVWRARATNTCPASVNNNKKTVLSQGKWAILLCHLAVVASWLCSTSNACLSQGVVYPASYSSSRGYRGGSPTAIQAWQWQPCPLWEPSP